MILDLEPQLNKYHLMIDQAFKRAAQQSSHTESQKMFNTGSRFTTSEKGLTKSASLKQSLMFRQPAGTVSKLKNQFKGRVKPMNKNAKELMHRRAIRSRQINRDTKGSLTVKRKFKGKQQMEL